MADSKMEMKDFYAALGASLKVPTLGRTKSKGAEQESASASTGSGPAFKVETVGATKSSAGQVSDELLKGGEAKAERAKANLPRVDGPLPAPLATLSPLSSAHTDSGLKSVEATSSEALIITATNTDTEEDEPPEQQVAVLDLHNVEWFSLVEKEKENTEEEDVYMDVQHDSSAVPLNIGKDTMHDDSKAAELLGGDYELIQDDELSTALADYVAASMARFPDAKQLSAEDMKNLLERTFGDQRHEGSLAKLWGWGNWAYSMYGWGMWSFQLYKDPAMVKLVATGVFKAAKWALVFVL